MPLLNGKLICSPWTGKLLCHPITGKLLWGVVPIIEVTPSSLQWILDPTQSFTTKTVSVSNTSSTPRDLDWEFADEGGSITTSANPSSGTLSYGASQDVVLTVSVGTQGHYQGAAKFFDTDNVTDFKEVDLSICWLMTSYKIRWGGTKYPFTDSSTVTATGTLFHWYSSVDISELWWNNVSGWWIKRPDASWVPYTSAIKDENPTWKCYPKGQYTFFPNPPNDYNGTVEDV